MTNRDVALAWAKGEKESGKGHNLRFEGPELISYDTTIGWRYENYALLSANSMSSSTAKHLSYARSAADQCGLELILSNLFVFGRRLHVPPNHKQIVWSLKDEIGRLEEKEARARQRGPLYHNRIEELKREINLVSGSLH